MEKNQICRMQADGSGYEVLGWRQSPTIYKDRIYYIKNKVVTDVYGSSTEAVGIAKMDQGCRIYYFDTKSRKKETGMFHSKWGWQFFRCDWEKCILLLL